MLKKSKMRKYTNKPQKDPCRGSLGWGEEKERKEFDQFRPLLVWVKRKKKVREANGYNTNEVFKIFARKGEKVYNTNGK